MSVLARPDVQRVALAGLAATVGWTLRLYHLGSQSFWYDEGTSITVAPRDLATIVANAAADIHPPLYYLFLHTWVGLAGQSEYAARLPSAIVGTMLIAILFRLARDLLGAPGGLAAAVLAAAAPLPIWYSQEARMYAQATTLGALATLLLARAIARPRVHLWAAYALCLAATLYSHYFAAAVPLAHGIAVGLWLLGAPRARLRTALGFAAGGAMAALAFVPWLLRTYGQLSGWPATSQPFGPVDLVTRTLLLFARGYGADRLDPVVAAPVAAGLVVGLAWLVWRRQLAALLIGAYFLVPLAAMMYVSLSRPFFHSKFVLLVAPAAEMLLAAAALGLGALAGRLARRHAVGVAVSALAVAALTLYRADGVRAQYVDPRLARDDYRGLARAIEARAEPGDAIVLDAPGQLEIFDFYYKGVAPRYPLPAARPIDEGRTGTALNEIASRHGRIFLVDWASGEADPGRFVEHWLDQAMYKSESRWWGGVRAALYVNPRLADAKPQRFAVDARFGDLADLAAVEVLGLGARAGDAVPVSLEWKVTGQSDARFAAFVHLLDRDEYLWGQHDSEPAGGARPTPSWRPGETIPDRHGVTVLAGTPPGSYSLEIGLYRTDTGARLPVSDRAGRPLGDRIVVGPVDVQPGRDDVAPSIERPIGADFGGAHLEGASLHPLGRDEAAPEVRVGELALLTLWWRAPERIADPPVRLIVGLRDAGGQIQERPTPLTQGRYPADRWSPNEWVRDPYKLPTDNLAPGRYAVTVRALDATGRAVGPSAGVDVGALTVR